MAHFSETVGKYSELAARLALLANGWTLYEPETAEAHDILARDPLSGAYVTIQVKTIRQRSDRRGELVVYAKKGSGEVYSKSDAHYIVGVWAANGEIPRVYMFENRNLGEYWASEASAAERWIELPIALDRETCGNVTAIAA